MKNLHAAIKSINEAVLWCEPRVDFENAKWCLRSLELSPQSDLCEGDDPTISLFEGPQRIESVIDKRAVLLQEKDVVECVKLPAGSKVLVCMYEETNFNYLASNASLGFLDGHDQPAWDTWIWAVDECLFSWIPREFVKLVDFGIAEECFDVLMWSDSLRRNLPEGAMTAVERFNALL